MARTKDLPPPPSHPELSPPAKVTGEVEIVVPGLLGEPSLEARLRVSPAAERAVVLCHPHPVYGGTMHSAVPLAITKYLAERGGDRVATLRFNFRGVGASEGEYANGVGETKDARAAIRELARRAPRAKMTLCGYSFGSWVGLAAAASEVGVERVVLVAPAVRLFDYLRDSARHFQGRIAVFIGDSDEFCDVDEARGLASDLGATFQVMKDSDHYFMRSRRKLSEAVLPSIAPELA